MKFFLVGLQFLSGLGLILLVLLHSAKGEGFGSIGGSAKMFASQKGMEAGLNRITIFFTIAFLLASFLLTLVR